MERASNLRMIALASVAALAVALPLAAATAGPAARGANAQASQRRSADGTFRDSSRNTAKNTSGDASSGKNPSREYTGNTSGESSRQAAKPASKNADGLLGDSGIDLPAITGTQSITGGQSSASADCGPQLTSPRGLEAQTCVLTDGRNTWGRTYYRNTTGTALAAVLTLMRPDQQTVVVHCAVPASSEPRLCETPHDPTAAAGPSAPPYQAVAEFAPEDGDGVLLHAGSGDGGGMDQ